jgi:hypothetical protein
VSLRTLRWEETVVDVGVRRHMLALSGGEGYLSSAATSKCRGSGLPVGTRHYH